MSLFPKFQNQKWKANDPATPATPATFIAKSSESSRSSNPMSLDVLNPETWKHPRPDLLIESELEAFNGWYFTMRNPSPKYGEVALSHEEATQLAWKFILDSMKNQHRRGTGRYTEEKTEEKNG
jgi:hypothetical protein